MCATGRSDATNLPRGSPRLLIGSDRGSPRGDGSPVSAWALALIPLHRSALLATQPGLRVDRLPLAPMRQTLGFDRCLQARDFCAGTRKLLTSARKVVGECFRSGGSSLRRHLGPLSTANGVAQLTLEDPAFDPQFVGARVFLRPPLPVCARPFGLGRPPARPTGSPPLLRNFRCRHADNRTSRKLVVAPRAYCVSPSAPRAGGLPRHPRCPPRPHPLGALPCARGYPRPPHSPPASPAPVIARLPSSRSRKPRSLLASPGGCATDPQGCQGSRCRRARWHCHPVELQSCHSARRVMPREASERESTTGEQEVTG